MNAKQFVKENEALIEKIKNLKDRILETASQIPEATEDNIEEAIRAFNHYQEVAWAYGAAWKEFHQRVEDAVQDIPYARSREATRKAIRREAGLL